MAIIIQCPVCEQVLHLSEDLAGTQQACSHCRKLVAVPALPPMLLGNRPAAPRPPEPVARTKLGSFIALCFMVLGLLTVVYNVGAFCFLAMGSQSALKAVGLDLALYSTPFHFYLIAVMLFGASTGIAACLIGQALWQRRKWAYGAAVNFFLVLLILHLVYLCLLIFCLAAATAEAFAGGWLDPALEGRFALEFLFWGVGLAVKGFLLFLFLRRKVKVAFGVNITTPRPTKRRRRHRRFRFLYGSGRS